MIDAAKLRALAPTAALAPLLLAAMLCLGARFGDALAPTDAVIARAEPAPIAAMRRLFPKTNAGIDAAARTGNGDPENLEHAVAWFRGWMGQRAVDVLNAPDDALLAVAAARLHVMLAARAEDPRLCIQYARAPAGGVAQPASAPSPLLAEAVDDELVAEVAAARAGADRPTIRPADAKPWLNPAVRRRANWYTQLALRGSPRLEHATEAHRCGAYIEAYRLAIGLPPSDGAALAASLLGRSLPPPPGAPAPAATPA